ncbi:MAG: hypothetical protein EOP80_17475, partial [Variovorax sp.]
AGVFAAGFLMRPIGGWLFGREHARRVEQLRGRVGLGEEGRREIQRAERVDVEVEPFDQVARRGRHDRKDAMAFFFRGVVRRGGGDLVVGCCGRNGRGCAHDGL